MIVALRANLEVSVDLFAVNNFLAGIALDPETFRDLNLLCNFIFVFLEPGHDLVMSTEYGVRS